MLVTGDRVGDALLKWPVISGLKHAFPNLDITWVAGRRASVFCGPLRELAKNTINTAIENANIGNSWLEMLREPPSLNADVVISTEPKMRNALLAKRIPHRRFVSPALNFRFSDVKPQQDQDPKRSVQDRLQQLFELAFEANIEPLHVVPVTQTLTSLAGELLPTDQVYIGFSPGAGGARKRWPLARFIDTAKAQSNRGRCPVFFLGPDEQRLLTEIKAAVPTAKFPEYDESHQRRGGVMLSIALAARMACSVANDSGGGHILAAGGRPLVSLYGHTSAMKFQPKYGPHIAINASQFSSQSIDAIPVHAVLESIEQGLGS